MENVRLPIVCLLLFLSPEPVSSDVPVVKRTPKINLANQRGGPFSELIR